MKRMFLGVVLAMAVASTSPALADPPPTNKNTSVLTFNCARGTETTTFQAAGIAQSRQLAGQVLDSTAVVVIVRIFVDERGDIRGVVEQVRTGRKEPIHAVADVSRVIAVMVAAERPGG